MAYPTLVAVKGDPTTWTPPSSGYVNVGINSSGQLVLQQSDSTILPIVSSAPTDHSQTSSSGPVAVAPMGAISLEIVTLGGSARAVPITLSDTSAGVIEGAQARILCVLPATAGLAITFYDATAGAITNASFTTDGSVRSGSWLVLFTSGAWNLVLAQVPAY